MYSIQVQNATPSSQDAAAAAGFERRAYTMAAVAATV
jgi:hypothetical protein